MPIQYDIQGGILLVTISGAFTPQDFAAYITAIEADVRYRPELPRLIQIADDATFPSSGEINRGAAETSQRMRGSAARFAYVARTPLAKGIASMFMGNAGLSNQYQIFDVIDDARAWLVAQQASEHGRK